MASVTVKINSAHEILTHAKRIFEGSNIRQKDALELASAEESGADVFLTTDDRLIRMGTRSSLVDIKILNPIDFLGELARTERLKNDPDIERCDKNDKC